MSTQDYIFSQDLDQSKKYEILTVLLFKHFNFPAELNTSKILSELKTHDVQYTGYTSNDTNNRHFVRQVEVKFDRYTSSTHNICIEYQYRSNPSGINTTTSDYYFYYSSNELYLINVKKLKEYLYQDENYLTAFHTQVNNNTDCFLFDVDLMEEKKIIIKRLPYTITDDNKWFIYFNNNKLVNIQI